jgi:uncharacterized protein (UPF0276 family)
LLFKNYGYHKGYWGSKGYYFKRKLIIEFSFKFHESNQTKSLVYCDLLVRNKEIIEHYAYQAAASRKIIELNIQLEKERLKIKYSTPDSVSKVGTIILIVVTISSVLFIFLMDINSIYINIRNFFDITHKPFVITDVSRQRTFSIVETQF